MNAKLQQASDHAMYLRGELLQAHAKGAAVESLILLPMIQRATEMERDINALINAREADGVEK